MKRNNNGLQNLFSGMRFGRSMGITLFILGLIASCYNYYTVFYKGYYGSAVISLNGIILILGLALMIVPGAPIIKEKDTDNDMLTILWWKESSRWQKGFWITTASVGMIGSNLLMKVFFF